MKKNKTVSQKTNLHTLGLILLPDTAEAGMTTHGARVFPPLVFSGTNQKDKIENMHCVTYNPPEQDHIKRM